jgi:hypothetical protein
VKLVPIEWRDEPVASGDGDDAPRRTRDILQQRCREIGYGLGNGLLMFGRSDVRDREVLVRE